MKSSHISSGFNEALPLRVAVNKSVIPTSLVQLLRRRTDKRLSEFYDELSNRKFLSKYANQ